MLRLYFVTPNLQEVCQSISAIASHYLTQAKKVSQPEQIQNLLMLLSDVSFWD